MIQLARENRLDLLLDIYYCLSLYKRVCYDDKGVIGRDQGRFT